MSIQQVTISNDDLGRLSDFLQIRLGDGMGFDRSRRRVRMEQVLQRQHHLVERSQLYTCIPAYRAPLGLQW